MTDKHTQELAKQSNAEKDPADWVTGDEPMTGAQRSYLKTLSEEAKQPFDETLTKGAASTRIEELQALTGRGTGTRDTQGAQDKAHGDDEAAPRERPPAPQGTPAKDESPLASLGAAVVAAVIDAEKHPPKHGSQPGGAG